MIIQIKQDINNLNIDKKHYHKKLEKSIINLNLQLEKKQQQYNIK